MPNRDPKTGRFVAGGSSGGYNLGSAYGSIVIDASGVSAGVTQAISALESGIAGMGRSLASFGQSIAGVGAQLTLLTAPLLVVGKQGLETAADFDTLMKQIELFGGVAPGELETVRQFALKMGADTQFSAGDAAGALLELLKAGQDLQTAMTTLPTVMELATVGQMSLAGASGIVSGALSIFGLNATDAARVSNALAAAANASRADVGDLGQALTNVGPIAKQFGLSVEDTSAILAIFANNGIMGAEAGTQLKSMLLNLSRPTAEVQAAYSKLGVSLYDATGNTKDFNSFIKELAAAMRKLPAKEQNELMQQLGGSYGIVGLQALFASDGLDSMLGAMGQAPDAASVAADMMNTFSGKVENLKGAVETFWIETLTPFMNEALAPLVDQLIGIVNGVTAWARKNPQLTKIIAAAVGVAAAFGVALVAVGGALSAIGSLIAVVASPIGVIVAALVGLYLAFESNFLGIRDFLQPILDNIAIGFETLVGVLGRFGEIVGQEGIGAAIGAVINAFMEMFGLVENDTMSPWAQSLGSAIVNIALTIAQFVHSHVLPAINAFVGKLQTFWADIQPGLQAFFNWVTVEALPLVADFIRNVVAPAFNIIVQILSTLWDIVSPALTDMFNWFMSEGLPLITGMVQGFIDKVGEIATKIGEWIQKNPELFRTIMEIVVVLGIAGIAVTVFTTIWGLLTTAIAGVRTGLGLLNTFLLGPTNLALFAVIAAVGLLIKAFMDLQQFLKDVDAMQQAATIQAAPLITKHGISKEEFIKQAWESSVAELGDFGARLLWGSGVVNMQGRVEQMYADAMKMQGMGNVSAGGAMPAAFAAGGFTGNGNSNEIAGYVHRNEYVVPENGALVMRGGGGDTYNIALSVPVEVLRDTPNLERNAASFADAFRAAMIRKG